MTKSNLPANIGYMATGLAAAADQAKQDTAGDLFMKLDKDDGVFIFGPEETEVEEGSLWAISPMGFKHGWVAWGDEAHGTKNQNLGERLVNAATPKPTLDELPPVQGSWSESVGITLMCVSGEDEGTQCLFKGNSFGVRKLFGKILGEVVEKINEGSAEIVPVVTLKSESYKHKSYGRIYNPIFEIESWTTLDASTFEAESEDADDDEDQGTEPAAKPERKRKRGKPERKRKRGKTAKPPAEEPPEEDDDEEDAEDAGYEEIDEDEEDEPEPEPEPEPEGRHRRRRRRRK